MSIQAVIENLKKITQLHQSLLGISENKTECLKEGDIEALQNLLKQEQKHAAAINQLENIRLTAMEQWASDRGVDASTLTVTVLLEKFVEGKEKEELEQVTVQLAELLVKLKQQGQLNQQLTQQSLQFVKMSLDMLSPSIKTINYGNDQTKRPSHGNKRSIFDSKA